MAASIALRSSLRYASRDGSAALLANSTGRAAAPEALESGRSSENAVSRRRERLRNSFLSRLFAIVWIHVENFRLGS